VVLVRQNLDAQSVVITGVLAGGSIFEDPTQAGLAAITAEGLLRGTATRDFEAIHETLESGGMSLELEAGRHYVGFSGKALGEDLPTLLTLLGDALRHPTFPDDHIDLIKGEIITGLQYSLQDTRYMAGKAFRELAYPAEHIYSRGTSGEIETVQRLTAQDLRHFHAQQYGPGKLILVIVGAVEVAQAVAEAERVLGDWHNPQQQTDFFHPPIPTSAQINFRVVELAGKTQSDIVLGIPGPARTAPDYQAARLANNILGVFGMMGRLGASVREQKGLAYYCSSGLDGGTDRGAWRISAGVNPKNVKLAVDSIRLEIERMVNEPVSASDLADNQANLTGRLPLLLENNSGVAGNMLVMEQYNLGLDYLRRYNDLINAVTVTDVQRAFQTYWQADAFSLAIAGPKLSESPV
jgi:zinc protease